MARHNYTTIAARISRLQRIMKAAWDLYYAPGGDRRRWDYVYTCLHKYEPLYYSLKSDCEIQPYEQADIIINALFDGFNSHDNTWEIVMPVMDDAFPHAAYEKVMHVLHYCPHIMRRIYEDAAEYYECKPPHGEMDMDYAINNLPYLWELAEGEDMYQLDIYGMYRLYVPFKGYAEYPVVWHCPATWDAPETWDNSPDYDWAESLPLHEAM